MRSLPFLALALPGILTAQHPLRFDEIPASPAADAQAAEFRSAKIQGPQNLERLRTLRKALTWHKGLASACRAAHQTGQPVLLVQALGELSGFC